MLSTTEKELLLELNYTRRLMQARESKGFSPAEVAERVSVLTATYSRWERGEAYPQRRYRILLDEMLFDGAGVKTLAQEPGIQAFYNRLLLEFGQELIRRRLEKGLSQTDVAKSVEVRKQNVCSWEAGRYFPGPDNLAKLDALLGNESR